MKRIILIQHCQSQHHVDSSAGSDSELTGLGRRQAEAVAARLKQDLADTPCRLYSSDLKRAAQTAEIVGEALGLATQFAPELREFDGGSAAGKSRRWAEENFSPEWATSLFDSRPCPGAETWREFQARVSNYMDGLVEKHGPQYLPILVVHGGTLSNIVVWWLRLPLDDLPERTPFAASPASISVLRRNQYGNPVIERLNDRSHLYRTGLAEGADMCC